MSAVDCPVEDAVGLPESVFAVAEAGAGEAARSAAAGVGDGAEADVIGPGVAAASLAGGAAAMPL
ncbi:MAG: hypothetical protein ACKOTB_05175, partial [Planctomycetia bacterium]